MSKGGPGIARRGGAMTFAQIGAALGITTEQAWSIFATAMRKLRRHFGDDPDDLRGFIEWVRKGGFA